MENVKVSVLIYVLNGISYIEKCICSVINQTLKEIEILIIDGGSTDGTLNVIERFIQVDPRIRLIQSAPGVGVQFNTGLKTARGEYIGICESDDYILPDMYEKEYEIAKRHRLDFLRANYEQFFELNGREILFPVKILEDIELYNKVLDSKKEDKRILKIGTRGFWSGLYHRNFLLEQKIFMNPTPGASYQDTSFAFLSEIKGKRVMVLNNSFYRYRLDNPNSSVNSPKKVTALLNEYELLKNRLVSEHLFDQYKEEYFSWKLEGYFWFIYRLPKDARKEFAVLMYQDIYDDLKKEKYLGSKISDRGKEIVSRVRDSFELLWEYLDQHFKEVYNMRSGLKSIPEQSEIVIFGNGDMGRLIALYMTFIGKNITAYIDNNKALWGMSESGIPIMDPQWAAYNYQEAYYVIANVKYYKSMREQLLGYGIDDKNIIICHEYNLFFDHILLEAVL